MNFNFFCTFAAKANTRVSEITFSRVSCSRIFRNQRMCWDGVYLLRDIYLIFKYQSCSLLSLSVQWLRRLVVGLSLRNSIPSQSMWMRGGQVAQGPAFFPPVFGFYPIEYYSIFLFVRSSYRKEKRTRTFQKEIPCRKSGTLDRKLK
jgi:hypothetical protein